MPDRLQADGTTAVIGECIVSARWLFSPGMPILEGGALLLRNGRIAATGRLDHLRRDYNLPLFDYPGCAIVPGLINAHTHLELTHFPAWRIHNHVDYHPHRFVDWIIQMVKVKRNLTAEDYAASFREGVRICLESGTTAVGDIVSRPGALAGYSSDVLGGRMFFEVLGQDRGRLSQMLSQAVESARALEGSVFSAGLAPHAVYTIGDEHYDLILQAAREGAYPMALHLSESEAETEFVFESGGQLAEVFYPFVNWQNYLRPPRRCSPTELLHRHGMLTPGTLAIHCVHVSRADVELLKKQGVTAVLCPRSNERLNVGVAPVALMKKLGITMVLGTDSLASNDSLSLWDEMRFALQSYNGHLNPLELLEMATVGGATALGLDDGRGALTVGQRADFQLIGGFGEVKSSELLPEKVLLHGDVVDVYVAGQRYRQAVDR